MEEICVHSNYFATNIYVIVGEGTTVVTGIISMLIGLKLWRERQRYKCGLHGNFKVKTF